MRRRRNKPNFGAVLIVGANEFDRALIGVCFSVEEIAVD
jgi:hypothetical protein